MPLVVLLGPQRLKPTLVDAVRTVGVEGPVAAVTAGWQEREDEIDELSAHLGRPVRNLRLHHRGEDVLARDPELLLAYGDLLDRRRRIQDLYRARLGHAKAAARALFASEEDPEVVEPEREAAVEALRLLDRGHLERLRRVAEAFIAQWRPRERPAVAEHREEIARILERCGALAIAGGHVQVLLDRLLLFGVTDLAAGKPVFAWSAGAMACARTVVLFHDSPPQGAGDAEVLGHGLGLVGGVLPFPHARRRLRLGDPVRVALLARRFRPLRCLAMDEGARVTVAPGHGAQTEGVRELRPDGTVVGEARA